MLNAASFYSPSTLSQKYGNPKENVLRFSILDLLAVSLTLASQSTINFHSKLQETFSAHPVRWFGRPSRLNFPVHNSRHLVPCGTQHRVQFLLTLLDQSDTVTLGNHTRTIVHAQKQAKRTENQSRLVKMSQDIHL